MGYGILSVTCIEINLNIGKILGLKSEVDLSSKGQTVLVMGEPRSGKSTAIRQYILAKKCDEVVKLDLPDAKHGFLGNEFETKSYTIVLGDEGSSVQDGAVVNVIDCEGFDKDAVISATKVSKLARSGIRVVVFLRYGAAGLYVLSKIRKSLNLISNALPGDLFNLTFVITALDAGDDITQQAVANVTSLAPPGRSHKVVTLNYPPCMYASFPQIIQSERMAEYIRKLTLIIEKPSSKDLVGL
jgi:hypothetical protein